MAEIRETQFSNCSGSSLSSVVVGVQEIEVKLCTRRPRGAGGLGVKQTHGQVTNIQVSAVQHLSS